jgi:chorismate dehydratase
MNAAAAHPGKADVPRIGRIEFINCFPLYLHFEEELEKRGFSAQIVSGSPAELNRLLVAGEIDLALPSSIEFARHAEDLVLLDGLAIGSVGAVDSVQLFAKTAVRQLKSIALTEKSATSVTLLRVLCRDWGITPRFAPRLLPLADTLDRFDGLLLIGDEALHMLRAGVFHHHLDLGEAWLTATGLPMVFAVSVARRDFAARQPEAAAAVQAALIASRDRCAARPRQTAAAAALVYDFSQSFLERYFDRLRYGFTAQHRAGLREFYRRAHAIGELDAVPDIDAALAPPHKQTPADQADPATAADAVESRP